jgi:O-acetyl-ADP-ribose deacetylase (regulator of RNase III)
LPERILVIKGDIALQKVDAIVNAANNSLLGGSGVDRSIHRAAGPSLLDECKKLGGCPTGEAKITGGHNLPAKWIIHTVGPVWDVGNYGEDEILARCYKNCLALVDQYGIKTIAFPSISTGVFRFPLERASKIALREINAFLEGNTSLEEVVIVCFNDISYQCYLKSLKNSEIVSTNH